MQLATAVDRHRRPIVLTAVTLTAAALAARAAGADPDPLAAGLAVPLAVALLLVFPIMVAPVWRKRTGLRLDEPTRSFRTPRTGVVPLFGVIHLTLLGILLLIRPTPRNTGSSCRSPRWPCSATPARSGTGSASP